MTAPRCECGHTSAAHYFAELTLTMEFCEVMACECRRFARVGAA